MAGWLALVAIVAALGIGSVSAAPTPSAGPESGAVGLTRASFEATYGSPTASAAIPGPPSSDEAYAYGTQSGMIYVTYRHLNGEQVAVEFAWVGNGVTEATAAKTIAALLPGDAKLTERYVAPATPGGLAALMHHRYASAALAGYNDVLAPEILAIQQEKWDAATDAMTVTRVSLTLRDRTQLTN